MTVTKFEFTPATNLTSSKATFLLNDKEMFVYGAETESPVCYSTPETRSYKGAMNKLEDEAKISELVEIVKSKTTQA